VKHKSAFVMYSDLHNLQSGSSTKVEPGANICIITSHDRITLLQNYMRLSLAWEEMEELGMSRSQRRRNLQCFCMIQ
jgi:hypothetical protein